MKNYRLRSEMGIIGYNTYLNTNVKIYKETNPNINGFLTLDDEEKELSYGSEGFISKLAYVYLTYYPMTFPKIYLETSLDAWTYVGQNESERIINKFKIFKCIQDNLARI